MTRAPRPAKESAVETTHVVLPPDTNNHGTAFGGRIMEWMDVAAGICAGRHCRGPVVTVSVDELHFARPIRMGDVVIIRSSVNCTGKSSMEVGVRVEREDARTRHAEHCLSGYFTFVAVDDTGRPAEVPQVLPESEDEIRRNKAGLARRARRLAERNGSH